MNENLYIMIVFFCIIKRFGLVMFSTAHYTIPFHTYCAVHLFPTIPNCTERSDLNLSPLKDILALALA